MLRNLRANHAEQEDVVRTLGAAERLRLVSLSSPGASTPLEQLDCKVCRPPPAARRPPVLHSACALHVRCVHTAYVAACTLRITLRITLRAQVQLAYCVWRLRWEERRDEARALLQELTADERVPVDDRAQLTTLLEDEWWS